MMRIVRDIRIASMGFGGLTESDLDRMIRWFLVKVSPGVQLGHDLVGMVERLYRREKELFADVSLWDDVAEFTPNEFDVSIELGDDVELRRVVLLHRIKVVGVESIDEAEGPTRILTVTRRYCPLEG